MRVLARFLALVMVLQATSAGFVPACDMAAKAKFQGCSRCQAEAKAPSCHPAATQTSPRKACCFFDVLQPRADGAVAKASLLSPGPTSSTVAHVTALADWSQPAPSVFIASPPGGANLATGPPRTTILLI